MDKFIIDGGRRLFGDVRLQSAKNSVLPLFAASVLTENKVTILDTPEISDAHCMAQILRELGADVTFHGSNVVIDSANAYSHELSSSLTKELRSSVFMLGSLLTRFHRARIAYPGGCDIGLRPIDLHLNALKRLGVDIIERDGYILCECNTLRGTEILLDFPSVGATENILLAAVKAEGTTVLQGAAKEPEIVDLQNFLNQMGAKVQGAGTDIIRIDGVKKLGGVTYRPMKDRIEAGTYLIAAAICGGEIEVSGIKNENIGLLLHKLRENGCKIHTKNDKIRLESHGRLKCNRRIETMPFPGFPTDLQAQVTALNCIAEGGTLIVENLFETRFKYVPELQKMGADIEVKGRNAFVRGVPRLHGATLVAGDLRGGAALVLAALGAEGVSEVLDLSHIDRGYSDLQKKLSNLGAKIKRVRI
ncbi:MAG: UDP-N-acetylglucosamine 1-carboxyvinyltransferase [Clostridiales bacterium]|nr:UDP-N-acetylglucosamine 1-carboxyvinyltransferase [Clostridiales bacterium]